MRKRTGQLLTAHFVFNRILFLRREDYTLEGCGSFFAAFLCPASDCPCDNLAQVFCCWKGGDLIGACPNVTARMANITESINQTSF